MPPAKDAAVREESIKDFGDFIRHTEVFDLIFGVANWGQVLQSYIRKLISLASRGAFHVVIHKDHTWPAAGDAVCWTGLVSRAVSRTIAVRFKTPLHLRRIPVIEDDLRRHRQAEGALNTLRLAGLTLQAKMSPFSVLF